jgi:hypothetical protein
MCEGYKVFNEDWQCQGFQFEIGKTYSIKGQLRMCENGFHFCQKLGDCFEWKSFDPKNKIAKVRASGQIIHEETKSVCETIKILEEIPWNTMLSVVNIGSGNTGYGNSGDGNSGYRNSGHRNSGHRNSGDGNSGDRNSGDGNSGDRNSGDWNSCNKETGFFNSKSPSMINVFNKPCPVDVWEKARKPAFLYFDVCMWVAFEAMTDDEKKRYPTAETCDGYLKRLDYKDAFQASYAKASDEDRALLVNLPNFDADVFYEISGIRIKGDK